MDRLEFRAGDFGKDRAFFRSYLAELRKKWGRWHGPLTAKSIYVARFDLNDDGQYELFVWHIDPIDYWPFQPVGIFRKRDGKWEEFEAIDPFWDKEKGDFWLEISEERAFGWRTIVGGDEGLQAGAWTDELIRQYRRTGQRFEIDGYAPICFTDRCLTEVDGHGDRLRRERPAR